MALLTDILKQVVATIKTPDDKAVHFYAGRYREVIQILTEKSQVPKNVLTRYPLIWLVMDYTERVEPFQTAATNIRLFIAAQTKTAASSMDRIEEVFKPLLWPIYERFFRALVTSGKFNLSAWDSIPHDRTMRPYWGTEIKGSNEGTLFNDIVDAIEIKNLSLEYNMNC